MKDIKEKLIPYSVARINLLVDNDQFDRWQSEGRFELCLNDRGAKCIKESELKSLCHSDEAKKASLNTLTHQSYLLRADANSRRAENFKIRIHDLLGKYRKFIRVLENLHRKYHTNVDVLNDETAVNAAYILFAKVINLLYLGCLCFENHYYHANMLLRPIDEHIDLAEYFIFTDGTRKGEKHLKEWFREDKAPRHDTIRQENAKYSYAIVKSGSLQGKKALRDELYFIKSKMVHPTLKEIIEIYPFDGFDYESCSFPRKVLTMTEFFLSSINTAFQGFFFCFHESMPLEDQDKASIVEHLKTFEQEKKTRILL